MNWRASLLVLLAILLAAIAAWAMTIGHTRVSFAGIVDAVFYFDGSRDHLVIMTVRLPRVATAIIVGAALAVAGAIMQAVTANPLASPGILGINAGAAFAVVLALVLIGLPSRSAYVWFAFAGAATAAAGRIYGRVGGRGRSDAGKTRVVRSDLRDISQFADSGDPDFRFDDAERRPALDRRIAGRARNALGSGNCALRDHRPFFGISDFGTGHDLESRR